MSLLCFLMEYPMLSQNKMHTLVKCNRRCMIACLGKPNHACKQCARIRYSINHTRKQSNKMTETVGSAKFYVCSFSLFISRILLDKLIEILSMRIERIVCSPQKVCTAFQA